MTTWYFFATHLVLEECIPDIFNYFRHSQNVTLTFLISLGVDTVVEHGTLIPNQLEGTGGESALLWVWIDHNHPLEQLCPSLVGTVAMEYIIIHL